MRLLNLHALVLASLLSAVVTALTLTLVLSCLGMTPRSETRLRHKRWYGWGGSLVCISVASIAFLFRVSVDHYNNIQFDAAAVVQSLALGVLAGACTERFLFSRLPEFQFTMVNIVPLKEAVVITGTIFALYAGKIATLSLAKSSNANMAAVYGQIYQNDGRVNEREFQEPDLQLLYLHSDFMPTAAASKDSAAFRAIEAKDFQSPPAIAGAYWNARLGMYLGASAADATDLQKTMQLGDRYRDPKQLLLMLEGGDPSVAAGVRRRASQGFSHVTMIYSNLHQVYDYAARNVIPATDVDTWNGYFEDIGPHPLALAVFWNWLQRSYMTMEFCIGAERRISGKRELCEFLEEQREPRARELQEAIASNSPQITEFGLRVVFLPRPFYVDLAQYVESKRSQIGDGRVKALYQATAQLIVFNHYIAAQPEYRRYVAALCPDNPQIGPVPDKTD